MGAPRAGPKAVIRMGGTFDLPAARLLENSLKRMTTRDRIRVDFSGVRTFNDFAVAVLAQAVKSRGAGGVRVLGLGLHQVRLLRYFGVGPEVFRPDDAPA